MKNTLILRPKVKPASALKPAMIESLNILQLSSEQLAGYLQQQMLSNPLLEWRDGQPGPRREDLYEQASQFTAAGSSLKDQLHSQAAYLFDETEQAAADYLIELLDEDGYLRESPEILSSELKISPEKLESIWTRLKTLKPSGVFALDLAECLRLQLTGELPEQKRARQLTAHLELLARRKTAELCRLLRCTESELNEAAALISRCDPHPGRSFSASASPLLCEVQVTVKEGQFTVTLLHSFSELRFKALPIQDPAAQDYLRRKTAEAKALIHAVEKRNQTLVAITQALCLAQQEFFLNDGPLIPLTRRELAGQLGLHPSTLSRACSGKGLEFNGRLYPFRLFFPAVAVSQYSQDQVLRQLRTLIQTENQEAPLNDQQLSVQLKALGFPISRRTVVKYRQKLRIPDSRRRKVTARKR